VDGWMDGWMDGIGNEKIHMVMPNKNFLIISNGFYSFYFPLNSRLFI